MIDQPTVSSMLVYMRIQAAANLGVEPQFIYAQTGLEESIFLQAEGRITLAQENAVWQAIITASEDDNVGLRIGQNFRLSGLGVLGYVLMNARTLGDSLLKFCAYERVIANTYHHEFLVDNALATYVMHGLGPWSPERKHTLDLSMVAVHRVSEELTGHKISPVRVEFQFQQPQDIAAYKRAFPSARLEFSRAQSSISFEKQVVDFPVIGSNPEMLNMFNGELEALHKREVNQTTYASKVKQLVVYLLEGETPSVEAVASKLALSVRNLQLKLKGEETSFQKLLDEVRRDMAIELLKNGIANKSQIAYLLGFSEISVFSRVFKKWTGHTPTEFQQLKIVSGAPVPH